MHKERGMWSREGMNVGVAVSIVVPERPNAQICTDRE